MGFWEKLDDSLVREAGAASLSHIFIVIDVALLDGR